MKGEWQRVKLGEVCSVITKGATPRKEDMVDFGIAFVRAENIVDGILRAENLKYVSKDVNDTSLKRSQLQKDDLLITIAGAIGRVAIVTETVLPANINQAISVVRINSHDVDVRYVYYFLRQPSLTQYLIAIASGQSVQANLNLKQVGDIELSLPPLPTQRRIAAVLGALDDKIELNRKMNANLEAQAQALFKSWFVDFAPWGGKMPAGWKRIALSDIADFHAGYAYSSAELLPSKTAMATIKNFERNGGFKLDGFKEIIPSDKLKETQSVELYDILVAHTDLTQKAEVVGNAELMLSLSGYENVIASSDLVKVVPKVGMLRFVIATLLKQGVFKQHCLRYVNGSTVLHMRKTALPEYEFNFPDDVDGLAPLAKQLSAYYKMMANNIEESRKLVELRDALLPKLMSGRLRVDATACQGELPVSAAEPLRRGGEVA